MANYLLCYQLGDGDIERLPNCPDTVSAAVAENTLRDAMMWCRMKGYRVEPHALYAGFVARRGNDVGAAWMRPVDECAAEVAEEWAS